MPVIHVLSSFNKQEKAGDTKCGFRFLINDTYRTDVHLLYPPYIIALASLYIGFCLTAMNNPSGTRTRSSSNQIQTLTSSISINTALNLPAPPTSAAEFLASFEVSLPVLLACVQDIIVLYPIWESFEPSNVSAHRQGQGQGQGGQTGGSTTLANATANASGSATLTATLNPAVTGIPKVTGDAGEKDTKEVFGPKEAEALVRRMIEERMVDVGHPDNAGRPDEGVAGELEPLAGRKRSRA